MRIALLVSFFAVFSCLAYGQNKSALPELPADVPKNGDIRMFLSDGSPAGQDVVWKDPDGTVHEFWQFNDRGRGPKTYSTYKLDAGHLVVEERTTGVDYMKKAVEETFTIRDGQAVWKNQSEDDKAPAAGKFYIDMNAGPESGAMLARALLKQGGQAALLPSGSASIRRVQSVPVEGTAAKANATLYEITGLSFTPVYLWLDDDLRYFASTGGWSSLIRQGFESSAKKLQEIQDGIEKRRSAEMAGNLVHKPAGDLVIRNVSVFDPVSGSVAKNRRIHLRGDRIVSVDEEKGQAAPAGATIEDGAGRMALPGLWDMHAHLFPQSAFLDVAAGVTSVRDLGNKIEELDKLEKNIREGAQIGPRIVRAGFIDGTGPFQGPIATFADTPEQAVAWVKKYAGLGYVQIKVYSSLKPELVPVIAAEAHKLGLRLSGHVPATMIAEQFVAAGADEIQHINFIMLNFMPDVKETRNPDRFLAPGKRGASIDVNSPEVSRFIAFLREHHTTIDPTMATFEGMYTGRPGTVDRMDAYMFDRLPVQIRRSARTAGGALPVDAETDKTYRESWANMLRMLKKLYDSGVPIVAGTDESSGYALHRELEIYNEAGIPAVEVLRIATLDAAKLTKRDKDLGSITPGKIADLILVKGDPTTRISDIRNIDVVIQSGNVLRPNELYKAMGIAPK